MIDTHCHLTYEGLFERLDEVLDAAKHAGVHRMITVGTSPSDAHRAVAVAQQHEQVFATAGLHPGHSMECRDEALFKQVLRELAAHPRVVALGEMGLDLHYPDPPLAVQQQALAWQLDVARELDAQGGPGSDLPLVIHNRKATDETLAMLKASGLPGRRFVFHCFTGDGDELDKILAFGAMVSFTGIVTFSSARDIAELLPRVPDDRIMLETDSPYLTPEPHRRVRPNEPRYVPDVARFVAKQRGLSERDMKALSDANAQRFFKLPEA